MKNNEPERGAAKADAQASAEQAARSSYGKLLASLSTATRDIAAAEEALAEAFARALEHWPDRGVPDSPEAWLLTTARNVLRDRFKSAAYRTNTSIEIDETIEQAVEDMDPDTIPDERLKLLFICAHPAIDEKIRTPLMLQTVLGLEAKQIASAFLIAGPTLAQQLVRAKRKIKDARIPFTVPQPDQMPERLSSVLEAIYGAYAIDWESEINPDITRDLSTEAFFLADLLVELLPSEPEVLGLAALIGFSYARREARESTVFVPLSEQNPNDWNPLWLTRAETLLHRASALGQIGRFQLEAAVQAVHCARRKAGETDWGAIVHLYEGLLQIAPTTGAAIAQVAAIGQWQGPEAGLAALERLDGASIEDYQPAWATRAHLLGEAGRAGEAGDAYRKAMTLTTNGRVQRYLKSELEALAGADRRSG